MKTGGSDGDGERRWNEEEEEGAAGRAQGVRRVVEECEVKRVVRGLKRAETRWVRCQG